MGATGHRISHESAAGTLKASYRPNRRAYLHLRPVHPFDLTPDV
jgi:hypothetical protein